MHDLLASSHAITAHVAAFWPQSLGAPPTHTPLLQVSPTVQNRPSSHDVPSCRGTTVHRPFAASQTDT
jgi:hypothetical protein